MAAPILLCDTTGMSNDRWLECRMHGPKGDIPYTIGGSDVAAIFGVSPWTTPLELWMIKKGRMKPREDILRVYIFSDSIYSSSKSSHSGLNADYKAEEWYQTAQSTDDYIFLPAHFEEAGSSVNLVISIAKRLCSLQNNQKTVGVIRVDANYNGIKAVCDRINVSEGGALFIMDSNWNPVYQNSALPAAITNDDIRSAAASSGYSTRRLDRATYIVNVEIIPSTNWRVIAINARNQVVKGANATLIFNMLMAVGMAAFFDYMLSHPKDTHWYPVFYVMANTGMRVGEITGLRWSDIDLKKGIIRVNHTLVYYNHRDEKGCYFSINTPKTKAGEREIPMTEGVKQAFLMEREFQSQAEISSKSRVDGYDDFIFVNRYGDVQNQGNLNKALRRMMRDCNDEILEKYGADSDPVLLPQFSCHILRHTLATRLCESGANLKFIQSILGHADVSTTMNIYVDVTDALKKKEITAFDDYMTTKLET